MGMLSGHRTKIMEPLFLIFYRLTQLLLRRYKSAYGYLDIILVKMSEEPYF